MPEKLIEKGSFSLFIKNEAYAPVAVTEDPIASAFDVIRILVVFTICWRFIERH